eukprot:1129178-Rhodomonas_salina.2
MSCVRRPALNLLARVCQLDECRERVCVPVASMSRERECAYQLGESPLNKGVRAYLLVEAVEIGWDSAMRKTDAKQCPASLMAACPLRTRRTPSRRACQRQSHLPSARRHLHPNRRRVASSVFTYTHRHACWTRGRSGGGGREGGEEGGGGEEEGGRGEGRWGASAGGGQAAAETEWTLALRRQPVRVVTTLLTHRACDVGLKEKGSRMPDPNGEGLGYRV